MLFTKCCTLNRHIQNKWINLEHTHSRIKLSLILLRICSRSIHSLYKHTHWRWKHKNVAPQGVHYTHSALFHIYTSVCLHLQQKCSLTDCIVDIIRQSSCTQYDIISMATSWGAGREVHSGSSSLTSTADVMEEQHQPQADSSHQHWIRPHHVPSCKDCASEVLHHDSTWNELQENYIYS